MLYMLHREGTGKAFGSIGETGGEEKAEGERSNRRDNTDKRESRGRIRKEEKRRKHIEVGQGTWNGEAVRKKLGEETIE